MSVAGGAHLHVHLVGEVCNSLSRQVRATGRPRGIRR
jgi:hypothetical protein